MLAWGERVAGSCQALRCRKNKKAKKEAVRSDEIENAAIKEKKNSTDTFIFLGIWNIRRYRYYFF